MFDPDGDQAAADSTRSRTSLDTGWSLNPRTARRLLTASYMSMITSPPLAIASVQNALASVLPSARHPTKNIAVDCNMAYGRERQVSGHQRLAVRRQLAQQTDTDTGRLLGVVVEAVEPVGVLESNLKHGVTGERQPIAAGRQTDDAVSGR